MKRNDGGMDHAGRPCDLSSPPDKTAVTFLGEFWQAVIGVDSVIPKPSREQEQRTISTQQTII